MAYRILIVDDSPAMRTFIRRVIEISGFDLAACHEAADGREALALLRGESVDAILTDINMPGIDGEELTRALAADEKLRRVPVLVVSTDGTGQRMERLLAAGARGYIAKPFLPEQLRAALERILGVAHA